MWNLPWLFAIFANTISTFAINLSTGITSINERFTISTLPQFKALNHIVFRILLALSLMWGKSTFPTIFLRTVMTTSIFSSRRLMNYSVTVSRRAKSGIWVIWDFIKGCDFLKRTFILNQTRDRIILTEELFTILLWAYYSFEPLADILILTFLEGLMKKWRSQIVTGRVVFGEIHLLIL